jgi:asparagine synthetase B (glutamine-hydrolysing)
VGSFLSGGIDSTVVAALAKRHNPNLLTFTASFERSGYSEADVAAESAKALGVEHIITTVSADDMMQTLPLIVWYLDDPVADPALVPLYFVAREARKHVKVVLSGEGADELFGGYQIYHEPILTASFRPDAHGAAPRPGPGRYRVAGGPARQGPAPPRLHPDRGALLRQRADLPQRRDGPVQGVRSGDLAHRRHRRALPGHHPPRRPDPNAVHRSVHLAARATSSSRPTR